MENPLQVVMNTHNLTQTELARALGVSHQYVHQICTGCVEHLPRRLMERLTELGVDAIALDMEYRKWLKDGDPQHRDAVVATLKRGGMPESG